VYIQVMSSFMEGSSWYPTDRDFEPDDSDRRVAEFLDAATGMGEDIPTDAEADQAQEPQPLFKTAADIKEFDLAIAPDPDPSDHGFDGTLPL
jgi:hypothetical protein